MKKRILILMALLVAIATGAWAQKYVVVGSEQSIFGSSWDSDNEDNLMTLQADGTYTKTYTDVPAMQGIQLKVVKDRSDWIGGEDGNNVVVNLTEQSDFTVVYNPSLGYVTVIIGNDTPVQSRYIAVVYCEAFGNDDASRNREFEFNADRTLTVDFPAASYVFVRNYDTGVQYCTDGWSNFANPVTLVNENKLSSPGNFEKFYVPSGVHTLYLVDNGDDTFTIAYDNDIRSGTPIVATHEYVDLGLSTGTLWATTNIGATNPEDYGDYFAWGETETNKSSYTWTTYKWRDSSSGQLTKYCTESSYGTVDNKTVLDLEDDAAYKNWGSDWRMPTLEELNELIDECSWEFMQVNGVKGYKVSGTKPGYTDRYIFLPAGGYKNSSYNNPNNEHGGYWLSTLNVEYCYNGMDLYFKSYFHNPDGNGERYNGQPIRPVYSTKTEPVVAPGLPIDETNFPDEGFRNWLKGRSYGSDGYLTDEEIASVDEMYIGYFDVYDLTGIKYFTELKTLNARWENMHLTKLDVSGMTKLETLYCEENELTSLNVSGCTSLEWLECYDNHLTTLDVSDCTNLLVLSCGKNQLTSLNLSGLTSLNSLVCEKNKLTSLNVSGCTGLVYVRCYDNMLNQEAMGAFIDMLPTPVYHGGGGGSAAPRRAPTERAGDLVAINTAEGNAEQNVITNKQVILANDKNWTVYSTENGQTKTEIVAESYHFTVAGVEVNELNYATLTETLTADGKLTSGSITFDPETNTLTLNGATINGYLNNGYDISEYLDGMIITVEGDNTIGDRVINGGGTMTINGTGNLLIKEALALASENEDDVAIVIDGPDVTVGTEEANSYRLVAESLGSPKVRINSGALHLLNGSGDNETIILATEEGRTPSIELGKNIDLISPENVYLSTIKDGSVNYLTLFDANARPITGSINFGYQEYYLTFDDVNIHSNNYDRIKDVLTEKGKLTKGEITFNPQTGILLLNGAELKLNKWLDNNSRRGYWTIKRPEDIVYYRTPITIEVQNDNLITGGLYFKGGESAVKGDGTLRISGGLVFQDYANTFSLNDATLILGSETLDMPALSSLCESLTLNLNSGRLELINNGAEGNQLVSLATVEGGAVINLGEGIIFSGNGTQIKTETTDYDGETIYITTLTDENGEPENGSLVVDDEETLGVKSIENGELRMEKYDYYNLQGQRVGDDYKGIVIIKGKKVKK